MSYTGAILVSRMNSFDRCRDAEDILIGCVHDLRQPLGTIETSAYLLKLLLKDIEGPVPDHLRVIERQVASAARMLDDAIVELRRSRPAHAAEFETETAVVS